MLSFTGIESLVPNNKNQVAKVNGEKITKDEFKQELDAKVASLARDNNELNLANINPEMLQSEALNTLIERKLLQTTAKNYRMTVTNKQIDKSITEIPVFQSNGKFDKTKLEKIIRQNGITIDKLRHMQYEESITSQLVEGISSSEFITSFEAKYFQDLELQYRNFNWASKPATDFQNEINITDQEITSYYENYQDSFKSQDRASIEYIELTKEQFISQKEIPNSELEHEYKLYLNEWKQRVRKKAKLAKIVIDSTKHGDMQQAQELANNITAKLKQGESFFDLAKHHSDDKTATKGGKLGLITKAIKKDPKINSFVNDLWLNETSIETIGNNINIFYLYSDDKIELPKIADVKSFLEKDIRAKQAEAKYIVALRELTEIIAESPDLNEAAEYFGINIQYTAPFSRTKSEDENPITVNSKVIKETFSSDILELKSNSEIIELNNEKSIVLRLKEFYPSKQLTLEESKNSIGNILKDQQIELKMKQLAVNLITNLKSGANLSAIAKDNNMKFHADAKASRAKHQAFPPGVLQHVFLMPKPAVDKPEYSYVVLANNTLAVIELKNVAIKDKSEDIMSKLKPVLISIQSQQLFKEYVDFLKSKAKISTILQ
jgi:peptidyl-prolyl cis-trans isomerase D